MQVYMDDTVHMQLEDKYKKYVLKENGKILICQTFQGTIWDIEVIAFFLEEVDWHVGKWMGI